MADIKDSVESVKALKSLILSVIEITKDGLNLADLPKAISVIGDIKDLVEHAPEALPELRDLSAEEAGELGAAVYDMVKAIILALSMKSKELASEG